MGRRAGTPTVRRWGNSWQARFTINGERRQVRLGLPAGASARQAEAEAAREHAAAVLAAGATEPVPEPGADERRLDVLIHPYLAAVAASGRDPRYLASQTIHLRTHFMRCDDEGRPTRWRTLDDITEKAIATYQVERRRHVGTVTLYKELVTLSRFLRWCKGQKLIAAIPEMQRPQQASSYQVPNFDRAAVLELLDALPTRAESPRGYALREWATFTWGMALRLTESLEIRWDDIDLEGERLTVRAEIDKAGIRWVLPLKEEALKVLRKEAKRPHKPSDRVWHVPRGMRDLFSELAEARGVRVTAHHLRHFRISELANGTRRLASVQFFARHTSIATTALYVRSTTEAAEEMLDEVARGRR
jgi:integrase